MLASLVGGEAGTMGLVGVEPSRLGFVRKALGG